jgi:hypothetical protein
LIFELRAWRPIASPPYIRPAAMTFLSAAHLAGLSLNKERLRVQGPRSLVA